jgi:hypothetical protein
VVVEFEFVEGVDEQRGLVPIKRVQTPKDGGTLDERQKLILLAVLREMVQLFDELLGSASSGHVLINMW